MVVAEKNRTIYATVPMQIYMTRSIKEPILEAIETIFDKDASPIKKLRAAKQLWKAFQAMGKLPEPTFENTWHPNSHNIIRLREWLFERCRLWGQRNFMIRRIMNFVIIVYEFDQPWRFVFDSLREEALTMEWKPRGYESAESYYWWKKGEQ